MPRVFLVALAAMILGMSEAVDAEVAVAGAEVGPPPPLGTVASIPAMEELLVQGRADLEAQRGDPHAPLDALAGVAASLVRLEELIKEMRSMPQPSAPGVNDVEYAEAEREREAQQYAESDVRQPKTALRALEEVDAAALDAHAFFERFVRPGRPVILRGGAYTNGWRAILERGLWSDESLLRKLGAEPIDESLLAASARPGGAHAKLLAETGRPPWTWRDFLRRYRTPGDKLYVSTDLPKALAQDVPVPRLLPCLHKLTVLNNIWVGGGGAFQQAAFHSDKYENLFTCVAGRKRFFLAAPGAGDALRENTAIPVMATAGFSATVLPPEVAAAVPLYEADLRAGDQMYLPAMWWHQVHSSHRNIAVATWFSYFEEPLVVGPSTRTEARSSASTRLREFKLRSFSRAHGTMAACSDQVAARNGTLGAAWAGCTLGLGTRAPSILTRQNTTRSRSGEEEEGEEAADGQAVAAATASGAGAKGGATCDVIERNCLHEHPSFTARHKRWVQQCHRGGSVAQAPALPDPWGSALLPHSSLPARASRLLHGMLDALQAGAHWEFAGGKQQQQQQQQQQQDWSNWLDPLRNLLVVEEVREAEKGEDEEEREEAEAEQRARPSRETVDGALALLCELGGRKCSHSWGINGGCVQESHRRGHLATDLFDLNRALAQSAWPSLLAKCPAGLGGHYGSYESQSGGSVLCEEMSRFVTETLYFKNEEWLARLRGPDAASVAAELRGFTPQEAFRALLASRFWAMHPEAESQAVAEGELSTPQLRELTEGPGGADEAMVALLSAGVLLPQPQSEQGDWQ